MHRHAHTHIRHAHRLSLYTEAGKYSSFPCDSFLLSPRFTYSNSALMVSCKDQNILPFVLHLVSFWGQFVDSWSQGPCDQRDFSLKLGPFLGAPPAPGSEGTSWVPLNSAQRLRGLHSAVPREFLYCRRWSWSFLHAGPVDHVRMQTHIWIKTLESYFRKLNSVHQMLLFTGPGKWSRSVVSYSLRPHGL